MGRLQLLGLSTRDLAARFVISLKCDLSKCIEVGEGAGAVIEPRQTLLREERAGQHYW